jgi:diguanylate cyclase (GGDEF)-like protein/PAS domain S-box-containing protein
MRQSPKEIFEKELPMDNTEEEFKNIIGSKEIQLLMDDFYSLTNMGMAVIDLKDNILISTGWQDICTKFHRINADSRKNCIESDLYLAKNIKPGSYSLYKCKNNMWDAVTPIIVGNKHMGNLFFGQFFFDDEVIDRKVFEDQAEKFGFDRKKYLAMLDKVPRWSKSRIKTLMNFYSKFAQMISSLSFSNIKLERTLSDIKLAEEKLRQQSEAMEATIEGIGILNKEGKYVYLNEAYAKIYGYGNSRDITGKSWRILYDPNEIKRFRNKIIPDLMQNRYWQGEAIGMKMDGNKFPQYISLTAFIDNGLICIVRDITDSKNKEAEILHLSYHDKLTGIYNRRFFEEEISRLNTKRQLPLSLVMGDLNGLKIINDTFGHNEGDKILKETAALLKKICRSDDILARWGGDEFVILLPKTSISDAEEFVARIKKECSKLIIKKIPLGLSMGIASKTLENQDINKIITDAESNMYKNKLAQKESSASSIISALEQTLYEKSSETREHAFRIKDNALKLGKSMKLYPHQLDELSLLASLHDIGKVAIPETILLKKGRLSGQEWQIVKRHPEIGFNIAQSSAQINHISKFILACHENWDGSGYPMGLSGESIPIISRIIFIADSYDVMTSERIYKKAMSKEKAINELRKYAGTQFDPELVENFIEVTSD